MAWNVGEKKNDTKRSAPGKTVPLRPKSEEAGESDLGSARGARNLAGGMEILELEFLLNVIEDTKGANPNDIAMRRLSLNEMIRREQLNEIDSGSLKVYAKDEDRLYGKDIQCSAMKELTIRTSRKGKV